VNDYDPVEGDLSIGMAKEAISELEGMSDLKKKTERHGELLLAAQMMLEMWSEAVVTANVLCEKNVTDCGYFIHAAFCLHEVGRTEEALNRLLSGPKSLVKQALYHYNLACYYAVLDDKGLARTSLLRAFDLDISLRDVAQNDEDLEGVDF